MKRRHAIGTALGLAAVALLVLATAFFVAAEFAIVATDRSRLETEGRCRQPRGPHGPVGAPAALVPPVRRAARADVVSLLLGFVAEPTIAQAIEPALTASSARAPHAASRWPSRSPSPPSSAWCWAS